MQIFEIFDEYNLFEILDQILRELSNAQQAVKNAKNNQRKTKDTFVDHDPTCKMPIRLILEILNTSLHFEPHLLRQYCLTQQERVLKFPFLGFLSDNALMNQDYNHQMLVIYLIFCDGMCVRL